MAVKTLMDWLVFMAKNSHRWEDDGNYDVQMSSLIPSTPPCFKSQNQ